MKKALYPLFIIANILDFLTTFVLFKFFGRMIRESNPLARPFVNKGNWVGIACAKGITTLFAVVLYAKTGSTKSKIGRPATQGFAFATGTLWIMVARNARVLYKYCRDSKVI